jgi:hypothetical protein
MITLKGRLTQLPHIKWQPRHSLNPPLSNVMIDGAEARTNVAGGFDAQAAICVREVDAQIVLQFTSLHKVGFALPRHTSRVIHRLKCISLSTTK